MVWSRAAAIEARLNYSDNSPVLNLSWAGVATKSQKITRISYVDIFTIKHV